VKTQSVRLKSEFIYKSGKCRQESCNNSEAEEEPPGERSISVNLEEEPPGKTATNRYRVFGHIPDNIWNDWKWQFRNRITNIEQLAQFVPLSAEEQAQLRLVTMRYPLSITPYYLSLINPHDPDDPIRKQAIPSILEMTMGLMGVEDPLDEKGDSAVPGLVHRYPDRVLMVITDICPILCRHCTRKREWRNGSWVRTPGEVEAMLSYVRQHRAIRDVIISGGDPLTLSTRRLEDIISRTGLGAHSDLVIMAKELGWTHKELIAGVLNAALERHPQCVRV